MKTRTKIVVSFIAFSMGYAILHTIIALIWKNENLSLEIIPRSLFMGGYYLLLLFLYTHQRALNIFFILFIAFSAIILVAIILMKVPTSILFIPYSVNSIIHIVYIFSIIPVAIRQSEQILQAKEAKLLCKENEEQDTDF